LKGKRLTRREIKEDAFVTWSLKASGFIKENSTKVIAGVVLAVIIAVGFMYVTSSRKGAEEDASRQLLAGILQQRQANYSGAAAAYEDVLSRFSGTPSGKLALLYLGHAKYELGDYDAAAESYEKYLRKEKTDKLTMSQAKRGLAACKENTGKFDEAAELYEQTAHTLDQGSAAPEDLMAAARCWKLAGANDKAMEVLQEVVDSYPDYRELDRAKVLLAELEYGPSH
jgi:predicted negative regulator of RcsB-dependent stress response